MLKTKIIKPILLLLLLFVSKAQYGQTELNQPYSRFGLGEMTSSSMLPYNGAMGGVSYTVQKRNIINPFNPASYAGFDTCTFVFDVGFSGEFATLKDNNAGSIRNNRGNLSHILFGFPILKWWKTSIGLLPVSDVSYSSSENIIDEEVGKRLLKYTGNGGINKVYLGNAFHLLPNLSVGFNIHFLFGNINHSSSVAFPDSTGYTSSRKQQSVSIGNFTGDFGIQYFIPLKEDYKLGIGLTYTIPSSFNASTSEYIYTFKDINYIENIISIVHFDKNKIPVKLPQAIGVGVSLDKGKNWFIGTDITYTNWNNFKFLNTDAFSDNLRFSLGGNYLPNSTGRNYFQRISYRAGFHYEDKKYSINGQNLNDMGVHIGFGLPFRKFSSGINLHFEYGKFGTTAQGLVQKDYFKIGLSLSTSDIWFLKTKYD